MKTLRKKHSWRRSGFTLMELMVSVAILLAVLAMIGTIFSTTSKAGGNATAVATIHRQFGQIAEMIETDLAKTEPATGMLGIAGGTILTQETAKDRDAGGLKTQHRADMLMMFAQREAEPYVFEQQNGYPLAPVAQVTYGHANFGKFRQSGGYWGIDTSPSAIRQIADPAARIVAAEWHLARRVLYFFDVSAEPVNPPKNAGVGIWPLTDIAYLTGQNEVLGQFRWQTITNQYLRPALFAYLGTASKYFVNDGVGDYLFVPSSSAQYLFQSEHWWRPVPSAIPPSWGRNEGSNTFSVSPLVMSSYIVPSAAEVFAQRSIVDPNPPLEVPRPMGSYFLPNCSEFKVEYTYDDPRELRVAPGYVIDRRPQPIRWEAVPDGGAIIWSNLATIPNDRTDFRRWPRALRITLRAWDPSGRLRDPVTRTIVHTW